MSRFRLEPAARLGADDLPVTGEPGAHGIVLQQRHALSLCNVVARRGAHDRLAQHVRDEFDILLPREPKRVSAGAVSFVWAGAGQWLAIADSDDAAGFERRLRSALAETASITDQSDGRTVIRVGGTRARDLLAKGVQIDLHPNAFRPGDAAITALAYMNVHFWQIDEAPTYEFAVFRSFARAFWEWLGEAGAEYGVAVV